MLSRKAVFASIVAVGFSFVPLIVLAGDMGTQLKGNDIVKALADHKIYAVGPDGKSWTGIYKSDGTAKWGDGSAGTWRVDGDKFCDHPAGDKEYCRTVYKVGNNQYQLMRPDGSKGALLTME
jgi:hypothetical protein